MELFIDRIPSEIGTVLVVTNGVQVCAVDFEDFEPRMHELLAKQYPVFELTPQINPLGVSGTTITYGGLADRLRKPKSARAVGMTNSLNPIAIVLPCHRVIGANGKLTGYAGGLDRKRWLLHHEGWGQEKVQLALLFT